jgi:hypothetical protein
MLGCGRGFVFEISTTLWGIVLIGCRRRHLVIALWFGHESIEATNGYLHTSLALKEKAFSIIGFCIQALPAWLSEGEMVNFLTLRAWRGKLVPISNQFWATTPGYQLYAMARLRTCSPCPPANAVPALRAASKL